MVYKCEDMDYHRKDRKNMMAIPEKIHPSCFIASLGSVSFISSGSTDTKAEKQFLKSFSIIKSLSFITNIKKASGRKRKNP